MGSLGQGKANAYYDLGMNDDSSFYVGVRIPDDLPSTIVRNPRHIETLMSGHITWCRGQRGPAWLAWMWVLTGAVTSPVSMSPPLERSPSRAEVLAERDAVAPGAISAETSEQIELARHILAWLVGETEEPPS